MTSTAPALATWIDGLATALEAESGSPLDFELLLALIACGPPPVVETWIAAQSPALARCLLWAALAEARRAREDAATSVVAATNAAIEAALASRHPLPAIALLRRWGSAAVPTVRAHLATFAVRPGEWFLGAHAALADALATDDPAASAQHLEVALRAPPDFSREARKYASSLEIVVVAASLSRRLAALGRTEEAAAQRDVAVDRFRRGLHEDYDDRFARFDFAEAEGIADAAATIHALLPLVFGAAPSPDATQLRIAGAGLLAHALAASGRCEEARALSEGDDSASRGLVCAGIAAGARDDDERGAALNDALAAGSREDWLSRYEEGLVTEGERDAVLCALGRALGACGRAEEGLAFLGPIVDARRDQGAQSAPRARDAVAAGLRGETVEPSTLFDTVSDRALAKARKGSGSLLVWRLVRAAASRPGKAGAALLEEACSLTGHAHSADSWIAAYSVHGRLAEARPYVDRAYAELVDREPAHVAIGEVAAFIVALVRAGQHDEASRELHRWLLLPPDARLLPAVFAVAAHHGTLSALAARTDVALQEQDARAAAYTL